MTARAIISGFAMLAVLALSALPAEAQNRRVPLSEMTDEELKERGFVWESQSAHGGSLAAGAIAIGPGFIFHGLGHYYQGDTDTGTSLLITEAIGIALGLAGVAIVASADSGSQVTDLGVALGSVGGSLFTTTWLVDILGSLHGSANEWPAPPTLTGIGQASAGYELSSIEALDITHALRASLLLELTPLSLHARTVQDAALNYQMYGGDIALRVVEGADPNDHLALRSSVEWANFTPESGVGAPAASESPLRVALATDFSLDLSTFARHLRNTVQIITLGVGFGRDVGTRAFLPGARDATWLIYEHHFLLPLTQKVMVQPYYRYDEAQMVGHLAASIGVFGLALHLAPTEQLQVQLGLAAGNGVTATTGISVAVF